MTKSLRLRAGAIALAVALQPCALLGQTAPIVGDSSAVAPTPPAAFFPSVKIIPAITSEQSAAQRYKTEVVCRTTVETGSFIAKRKACLTRKQWDYVDQEHRDEARKLMMDNMGKGPGF